MISAIISYSRIAVITLPDTTERLLKSGTSTDTAEYGQSSLKSAEKIAALVDTYNRTGSFSKTPLSATFRRDRTVKLVGLHGVTKVLIGTVFGIARPADIGLFSRQ